jgi:ferrous iron transport protein A
LSEFDIPAGGDSPTAAASGTPLSDARRGFVGTIVQVRVPETAGGLGGAEIERRLLEMGFVEDAPVELVHEGLFGRDPIAIKLADRTVALRRREARSVMVRAATAPPR